MKPLTTSVYTFPDLIHGGYHYVDKTGEIYRLVQEYKGQFFLARPRRFGKSLVVRNLKSLFQGHQGLFSGLAISTTNYEWTSYPVLHMDLGTCTAQTAESTDRALEELVDEKAREFDLSLSNTSASSRFRELIQRLGQRGKVVILIDEYDKPLLGHLGQETASEVQNVLKQFYSVIKATEPQQRFVLLTGVSKFSKVSVFSDLNNLTDLTMSRDSATLLGYTQQEVEENFPDYIQRLATTCGMSVEKTREDLRFWYNGYRFHQDAPQVYNPVSLMKCLTNREFKNYWFETGPPTFLLDLLKKNPLDLGNLTVPEASFSAYEPHRLHSLPLLFQTGHLTIKDTVQQGRQRAYRIGFPNFEIEESLSLAVASGFSNVALNDSFNTLSGMVDALESGDVDAMLGHLKTFFCNIPNTVSIRHEKYYQTIFFTVFKLIGARIEAEVNTNTGRIDAVVKTSNAIYIFEFKLHATARDAMEQILEKDYAAAYRDDPRTKTLVGVGFDEKDRNLKDWVIQTAS